MGLNIPILYYNYERCGTGELHSFNHLGSFNVHLRASSIFASIENAATTTYESAFKRHNHKTTVVGSLPNQYVAISESCREKYFLWLAVSSCSFLSFASYCMV